MDMSKQERKALRASYDDACNQYLAAFAAKHGIDRSDCDWVGDEPGGVAMIGDWFASMEVITLDIDRDAPEGEFLKWYDYGLRCDELELPDKCNYRSWLQGCPRYSEEAFERIAALRKTLQEAGERMQRAIREEADALDHIENNF